MPKPTAVIDYEKCHPERCDKGICIAKLECELKVLKQEEPYEMPYTLQDMCKGCAKCALACSLKAIRML